MRFEIELITPEKAAAWLANNAGNRPLRERRAAAYAKAIDDGKWVLTPDPIALGKRGRLLNGQHRLRAIMMASTPVRMAVAYDVPDEAFAVMDAGLPRAVHERLRRDARHTSILTAVYRLLAPRRTPQEYEIELMFDTFGEALRRLDQVAKPKSSKIDKAAQQAAFVVRMTKALAAKEDDHAIRLCWLLDKLRRGDLVGAPPIAVVYYRQICEGVRNYDLGVAPMTDQFCRAWFASDPEKEGAARLIITDHSELVRDARVLFRELTQNVFD